jgi:hypothetical protein
MVGAIVVALITLSTVLLSLRVRKRKWEESILDCSLTLVSGLDYRFSAGAGKLAE